MQNNNNSPSNNPSQGVNPFISAFPNPQQPPAYGQLYPQMNQNPQPQYPPTYTTTTSPSFPAPVMYQRQKTSEELERERKDAELARLLAQQQGALDATSKPKSVKEDEDFAKKLIFDESLKTKEQKMLQLLQDEAAAVRLQKEEEALDALRKRDQERERQDGEEARRLQMEEEQTLRRQEAARRDAKVQAEEQALRRMVAEEEDSARRRKTQQIQDEELAFQFQREEERRVQEEKDKAVAKRIQDDEKRAADAERQRLAEETRRIREEERRRQESIRREEERRERERRDEERRHADLERMRMEQLLADADLARRLENQLNIYIPPTPPPVPNWNNRNSPVVNAHTLAIHSQFCGCNKHNHWNNNHIHKIHSKYCNCTHPYHGHYTNSGLIHTHGVGCRLYCKYQNHVHTAECCRIGHIHNQRCHCAAKFS